MAESRTKNAARNIVFGFLNRFVSLVLPFITRTIIIRLLGSSYLGVGTLFSSILNFLSITELGFSAAVVYSMYKPIAEGDDDKLCALLNFYKVVYRIIGLAILLIGTVIIPFLPYLMNGEAPVGINVYLLYYIYLFRTVFSYLFFAYKQSILTAHQRSDLTSNMHTVVTLVVRVVEIAALYYTRNFYLYALVPLVGSVINNVVLSIIVDKKFPHLKGRGKLDASSKKEILKKVTGLFLTKLNSIVIHSSDILIISAVLGLTLTAQYGNYYYVMNAVCGFIMVFYSSMKAGIGNKIVTDSIEENYDLFKNLIFANGWIVGWASISFLCLFETFMTLWVGEALRLGNLFAFLFAIYFFVYEIHRPLFSFKDAVGLWNEDKLRLYVTMIMNLALNILLVRFIGVYGVVIATIATFAVSLPWVNHILHKYLFKEQKPSDVIFKIIKSFLITVIAALPTYLLCSLLSDNFISLVLKLIICLTVPNVILFFFYHKYTEFVFFKSKVKSIITKKLPK